MKTPKNIKLSVLDVCPVPSGSSSAQALRNTLDLAQFTESLCYTRYWLAEHHNFPGIASSAPEIVIGHVAGVTSHIRVGAGGIMLPNHSPLKVAETFRVLEALHPGRIDLGLGRAPGTDPMTAMALRRSREAMGGDQFPDQLGELLCYFSGAFPDNHPYRKITAVPADVETPELWLLSSSGSTALMAAQLGLGFAFAHHINPLPAVEALRQYHREFQPMAAPVPRPPVEARALVVPVPKVEPVVTKPLSLLAVLAVCAETDAEAEEMARPVDLARLRMEQGKKLVYPSLEEAKNYPYNPLELQIVKANRERMFVGSPQKIKKELTALADQTGVEEIMVLTITDGHQDRRKSYELLAKAFHIKPPE